MRSGDALSGGNASPPLTPLSMWILLALANEDLHGYALLQEIERQTEGEIAPGTSALYAALHRLLTERLIVESPDLPARDEDQRRRYYRLTKRGREAAAAEAARLARILEVARDRRIAPLAVPAPRGQR
jgi:DNA-binding PadR family transcriptional regulator